MRAVLRRGSEVAYGKCDRDSSAVTDDRRSDSVYIQGKKEGAALHRLPHGGELPQDGKLREDDRPAEERGVKKGAEAPFLL